MKHFESGFHINGEVRDISNVRLSGSGKDILVFAPNNDSVRLYSEDTVK